jgi:glutamate:GABA antiporter
MTVSGNGAKETSLLRREMGLWDVVLFNVAAVLGPRWIARAAHAGESSLSLWILAALFFFVPTAYIIVELATRYPDEGGLYVWTKKAFGDFHGFVAGWCYWIYTIIYFPGLLTASMAMSVYIGGPSYAWLAANKVYLIVASLVLLAIAAGLNIVGLNIGKWLQNAGGVATYVPLVMLLGVGAWAFFRNGSATHFSMAGSAPSFDMDTLNFWSGIAFAFTGMELVCAMGEEVRDPKKTFPRSILISAVGIAAIYFLGTIAVLAILPADAVNTQNGVFQAISQVSAWIGVIAALLVTVGNAGGVGATVAGANRVPFAVGIDRYLPPAFGKLHPKWRTPYVAIMVQVVLSAVILIMANTNETISGAYEVLINATIVVYFIPFLYMYAAAIKLAYESDRESCTGAVLVPGGRVGVWIAGLLGFGVTAVSIVLALIPSKDVTNAFSYELKLVGGTVGAVAVGLLLYWRGARSKRAATVV